MNIDDDHLWTVEKYINHIHKNYVINNVYVNTYLPTIMHMYHMYDNNVYNLYNLSNLYN